MEDKFFSNPLLQPKTNYHLWLYGDCWKLTQNWCWSSQNSGTVWYNNVEVLVRKKSWHDRQNLWRDFVSGYYVQSNLQIPGNYSAICLDLNKGFILQFF